MTHETNTTTGTKNGARPVRREPTVRPHAEGDDVDTLTLTCSTQVGSEDVRCVGDMYSNWSLWSTVVRIVSKFGKGEHGLRCGHSLVGTEHATWVLHHIMRPLQLELE